MLRYAFATYLRYAALPRSTPRHVSEERFTLPMYADAVMTPATTSRRALKRWRCRLRQSAIMLLLCDTPCIQRAARCRSPRHPFLPNPRLMRMPLYYS